MAQVSPTPAGNLGDLKFWASLQDDVLRLVPFRGHGCNGGPAEGGVTVDTIKEIPSIDAELTGRNLARITDPLRK